MTRILLLFVALLAIGACASQPNKSAADALAEARAAVEAGNASIARGLAEKNAAAMAAIYAEDAQLMPPNADPVAGRAAIQAYWQGLVDAGGRDFVIATTDLEVSGALAAERGVATLNVPGPGGTLLPFAVKYLVVWRRQDDGNWRIRTDIWNDPPPAKDPISKDTFEKQ